jgi:hypothetical protein
MKSVLLFLSIFAGLLLCGPVGLICDIADTDFFLAGYVPANDASMACATAGGVIAEIYDKNYNDQSLQQFLKIRRGMRACQNTKMVYVAEKGLNSKGLRPPQEPNRMLLLTGMAPLTNEFALGQNLVLCERTVD